MSAMVSLHPETQDIVVGFWNRRITCGMPEQAVRGKMKSRGSASHSVWYHVCEKPGSGWGTKQFHITKLHPSYCWEHDAAEDMNVHFVWASLAGKKILLHLWSSICYFELPKKHSYQGKFSSCFILSKHIHMCCLHIPWLINVLCVWDSLIRLTIEISFSNAGSNLYQKSP